MISLFVSFILFPRSLALAFAFASTAICCWFWVLLQLFVIRFEFLCLSFCLSVQWTNGEPNGIAYVHPTRMPHKNFPKKLFIIIKYFRLFVVFRLTLLLNQLSNGFSTSLRCISVLFRFIAFHWPQHHQQAWILCAEVRFIAHYDWISLASKSTFKNRKYLWACNDDEFAPEIGFHSAFKWWFN